MEMLGSYFKNMFNFRARTNSKTFWIDILVYHTIGLILAMLFYSDSIFIQIILGCMAVVFYIANASITVRRLHDTGKSGSVIFVNIIPIFGLIYFIYALAKPTNPESKWIEQPQV